MKFRRALQKQLPAASSPLQINTLRELITVIFDFLAKFRGSMKPVDKQFEPILELALQQELEEVILKWLNQVPSQARLVQGTMDTTAVVISWAIFGSAVQWSRGEQSCSKEEMASQVFTIVAAGLSPILTLT